MSLAVVAVFSLAFEFSGFRARFFGRKRFRFAYATASSRADEGKSLEGEGWKSQAVELESGATLQILLRRAQGNDAPWLFYFPGNDPKQLTGGKFVLERIRGSENVNLCALSYRGFSGSTGEPELSDIQEDLRNLAHKFIQQEHIQHFHLAGFSIGGYFAAWTSARLTENGHKPASLTLFAPGYDLVMLRPSRWERYAVGDDYQMAPFLGGIHSPTLVLQGTADEAFGSVIQGRAAAAGVAGSTYAEFEGIGHEAIHEHEPALAQARDFWPQKR